MPSDIEFLRSENAKLHGQVLAHEWLLFNLICILRDIGSLPQPAAEKVFGDTVDALQATAIRFGKSADPNHTLGAFRIAEELRQQFLAVK